MIAALWEWFTTSSPAQTFTALSAVIVALRMQSNREHKQNSAKIDGISLQLNGELLKQLSSIQNRISRIEHQLWISEAND